MRRDRIVGIASAAICLMLIAGLSFALPGMTAGQPDGEYPRFGMAAGVFAGGSGFGYALIGLIAFALGVVVTILCYRIHLRNRTHEDAEGSDG